MTAIANDAVLDQVVVALDAVLDLRVLLHHERRDGRLTVPDYLAGLRAARDVERDLEELRPGEYSRAYELAIDDRAMSTDDAKALSC